MPDKISGVSRSPAQQPARPSGGKEAASQSNAGSGSSSPPASDSVSLTRSAQQMQKLIDSAANSEATDVNRVEQIRLALENDDYHIDASDIADRLLSLERQIGD